MMKVRTFPTTILLALLLLLSAARYPEPVGYVNDFAGVLSTQQRESLEARLRAYERETTVEVAVAIVASLEGETVEDYARGLFRAWGVGKAGKNNGVLVLVAPNERRVRIQTGYGLESQLTNSEAQAITREAMVPRFRENDYAGGAIAGAEAVIEALGVMPRAVAAVETPVADTARADTSRADTAAADTALAAAAPAAPRVEQLVEQPSAAPDGPVDPAVDGPGFNWMGVVYFGGGLVALLVVIGIVADRRRKAALRAELAEKTIPQRRAMLAGTWTRLGEQVEEARARLVLPDDLRRLDELGDRAPEWLDADEREIAEAEALVQADPDRAAKLLETAEGTAQVDAALGEIRGRIAAYHAAAEAAPGAIAAAEEAIAAADRAREGARGEGYRDRADDDAVLDSARQELQGAREALAASPSDPERAVQRAGRAGGSAGEVTARIAEMGRLRAATDAELPAVEREHASLAGKLDAARTVMEQLRSGYPDSVWSELGRSFERAQRDHAEAGEALREARRANSMEAQEFERAAELAESARSGLGRVAEVVPQPAARLEAQRAAEAALPAMLSEAGRSRASARQACDGVDVRGSTRSRLADAESAHARASAMADERMRDAVAVRGLLKEVTLEYHAVTDQARTDEREAEEARRREEERRRAEARRREEERRRAEQRRRDDERRAEQRRRDDARRREEQSSSRSVSYFSSSDSGSSSSSSSSSSFGGFGGGSTGGSSSSSDDSGGSFGGGSSGDGGASDRW